MDIQALQQQLAAFARERDWERFHSPKNLVMALSGEVGELTEIFQWLTEEQSWAVRESQTDLALVTVEVADVLIYLIRFADLLGVDLEQAIVQKIAVNDEKYPLATSKGDATKSARKGSSSPPSAFEGTG